MLKIGNYYHVIYILFLLIVISGSAYGEGKLGIMVGGGPFIFTGNLGENYNNGYNIFFGIPALFGVNELVVSFEYSRHNTKDSAAYSTGRGKIENYTFFLNVKTNIKSRNNRIPILFLFGGFGRGYSKNNGHFFKLLSDPRIITPPDDNWDFVWNVGFGLYGRPTANQNLSFFVMARIIENIEIDFSDGMAIPLTTGLTYFFWEP